MACLDKKSFLCSICNIQSKQKSWQELCRRHQLLLNTLRNDLWPNYPLYVYIYFCVSRMLLPSSPWSCSQRCWLLRGFITLQAICCPRWINLRNWLGSFRSKDCDSLSFLFAKACKVSTLSDDTIKLPTSGEMQKVGKWGSYLSEFTAHASMHRRVSCGDRWWKSWEDDLSFGITTAKHGDGDVTFSLCRLARCG